MAEVLDIKNEIKLCEECKKPLTHIRHSQNARYEQRFCNGKCRIANWKKVNNIKPTWINGKLVNVQRSEVQAS